MASPGGAYLLAAIFSERIYSPSELRKVFEEVVPLVLPVVGELVPDGYPRAAVQLSRAVGLTIGTIVTDNANYTTITTPILLGALPKKASLSFCIAPATFNQMLV